MGQYLLALVAALVVGAVIFGIVVLVTGSDPGLGRVEPDSRAVPLPRTRPLVEGDVDHVRFDTALRGYRMTQVDETMRRAAYDIGYKDELIGVLEAEVTALREGRTSDAEVLRRAREAALAPVGTVSTNGYAGQPSPAGDETSPDPEPAQAPEVVGPDATPDAASGLDAESSADAPPDAASGPDAQADAGRPAQGPAAEAVDAGVSPPDRA